MKTYHILIIVLALLVAGCQSQAKVQTQQVDGRTYTTMSKGDLTLTYVELDSSTAVVFRSAGGIGDIDTKCFTCTISKISECGSAGTPAEINACAKKKCQDAGQCPAVASFSFGLMRL